MQAYWYFDYGIKNLVTKMNFNQDLTMFRSFIYAENFLLVKRIGKTR